MILRVVVTPNSKAELRSGVSDKGRDWSFNQQSVRIFEQDTIFADRYTITLPEDVNQYPPGEYLLDLNTMYGRGSFDSLVLNRSVSLIPLTAENLQSLENKFMTIFSEYSDLLKKLV